jgi:hypothetical protein
VQLLLSRGVSEVHREAAALKEQQLVLKLEAGKLTRAELLMRQKVCTTCGLQTPNALFLRCAVQLCITLTRQHHCCSHMSSCVVDIPAAGGVGTPDLTARP